MEKLDTGFKALQTIPDGNKEEACRGGFGVVRAASRVVLIPSYGVPYLS
jgi:hypothetical protein